MYPESCTEKKFLSKSPLIPKLLVCIAPVWNLPYIPLISLRSIDKPGAMDA